MSDEQQPRLRVLRMLCDAERWEEFRQAQFTVADILSGPPIMVGALQPLRDVLELISKNTIRHVLVTNNNKLVGVISDRDVLKVVGQGESALVHNLREPVGQLASRKPQVVEIDTPIQKVASVMLRDRISCLPVVKANCQPIGIVTSTDLIWLLKLMQMANSGDKYKVLRDLVREIERLVSEGHLSDETGDELTDNLLSTMSISANQNEQSSD